MNSRGGYYLLSFSFLFFFLSGQRQCEACRRRETAVLPERRASVSDTKRGQKKALIRRSLFPLALVRPHFLIPTRLNLRAFCPITPRGGSAGGFPLQQSFSKRFITSAGLVGCISWCATGSALQPFNDSTRLRRNVQNYNPKDSSRNFSDLS